MSIVPDPASTMVGDIDLIAVRWSARTEPLVPHAVCAHGAAANALAKRILARSPQSIEHLRYVAADRFLLVLGEPNNLPWADGSIYLGREGTCTMYIPTLLSPSVHPLLLERALLKSIDDLKAPFAVLPENSLVVPVAAAQGIRREHIMSWLQKN